MLSIQRFSKWALYSILLFAAAVSAYFLAAYLLGKIRIEEETNASDEVSIYILTNGVHTDLVLPIRNELKDWSKEVLFENTISNDSLAHWVAFGWGDKGFYLYTPTWDDLTFGTAFRATFGLGSTAIHATFYTHLKESDYCKKIKMSKEQYKRLIDYVKNSFATDAHNHITHIKTNANYEKTDAFYEAKGRYSLFYTCNTWANEGLKSCGQKACLWTPFDTGIFQLYNQQL